jgi:hypothetical protein
VLQILAMSERGVRSAAPERKRKGHLLILLIVVGLIAFVLGLLVPIKGAAPSAPWITQEPPREDHRVLHPKGFSIVKPPGWSAHISISRAEDQPVDQIDLRASEKPLRDYTGISVTLFRDPPLSPERGDPYYVAKYQETDFLNMKAYERTDLRAGNRDYFTYELLVNNHGQWYRIVYQIPADFQSPAITNVPATMMPYIRSFQPTP